MTILERVNSRRRQEAVAWVGQSLLSMIRRSLSSLDAVAVQLLIYLSDAHAHEKRTMRHRRGGGGCSTTYRWQGEDNRCIVAMATYKSNSQDIGMSLARAAMSKRALFHSKLLHLSQMLQEISCPRHGKESGADIGPNMRRS